MSDPDTTSLDCQRQRNVCSGAREWNRPKVAFTTWWNAKWNAEMVKQVTVEAARDSLRGTAYADA